ncbi:uncharacterized protein MYCFIDRAFT_132031 [Pseudocercospora fijiensis CIRAD86]|uniref:Uncharacterized protein n=1 Tax=Pseudocercospora fijiensis (strain CIRAD86) TaxID=383855 RepID=M3AMU6_PSEFD|nr:uncharacterized protein MYCFIDRAFT_132031 [Pseudocercospora fijiensis CIRAD86]EME85916.1 hypothetical protein MYCFIDRAFT_132031 [Pseudocercospora fijiensis CIRAD86]
MNELSAEELKYQRELRTLVDGVIPVLLQHSLSDTGSTSKSRVSSRPSSDEVMRPIVEMGVALEKLKTMHRKIPLHEPGELLLWADNAAKVYADYLRVWRLGFQDIVVNLAPAEASKSKDSRSWDHDLPRNTDGDLYLARTFKNINSLKPSANAEDMTAKYHDLIADAKKRVNDEQARLEDEAAASIDATRARDPRSLAPITGVSIDPTRSVRARDYFDMDLVHSSGQQLGCKIEIIFRDDAPNRGKAGDVLFCEISVSGRWLLFPPIPWSLVSARAGERPGELVVMIRGFLSNARQWREVMSLRAETEDTSSDWLKMLGSAPMPPRLNRRSSFNMFKQHSVPAPALEEPKAVTVDNRDTPDKSRDPSPREIEVPIGEQYSVWMPSSDRATSRYSDEETIDENDPPRYSTARPGMHRRTSSVPSMDMPTIPKVRQPTRPESPSSDRDGLPSQKRAAAEAEKRLPPDPASTSSELQKRTSLGRREPNERPPAPPAHGKKPPGKTVASICAWSERGSWDSLHPEECQIFITPGLIEAFDLVQANSVQLDDQHTTPSAKGIKPLVALELTPLVPLRRGTAVDISIRSPPSSNSLLKSSSNILFRSRSPEDCERLYALINRARIDNPTYIALQNARGPVQQSNWGEIMDQRPNPMDKRRSWWNLGSRKSSTYRSQGSRAQSTAATESSVGTVGTAFSALRRFSSGSKIFNIGNSTITSRDGTRSTNSGSLSSGTATPIQFDPSVGTPLGINNAKVRMYMRESAGRWRDMGAARLTVLLPPRQDPTIAANPRVTGLEKRVIVSGKSKGETMLDVTLGESAFERVARTGIAVSVYEESPHVGAIGSVLPHQTTVYMIQLKSVSARHDLTFEATADKFLGARGCIHFRVGWQAALLILYRSIEHSVCFKHSTTFSKALG